MNGAHDRLLVVGSLHHDLMLDAPHLPRLGETVTGLRWYAKFGGKGGNQAVAAARAGIATRMLGAVGEDEFSIPVLHTLDEQGVDARWISRLPGQATGMSVAISDAQGDYGAVIVSGANLAIDERSLDDDELWQGVGLLLLQNEVDASLNLAAAQRAVQRRIRVCLNAAPARELSSELLGAVDILIVNAIEAEALCGRAVATRTDGTAAAASLAQEGTTAIVTLGAQGVAVATGVTQAWHVEPIPVRVASTHGAGDTFTGVLCASLLAHRSTADAVHAANAAAARHVAGDSSIDSTNRRQSE